MHLKQLTSWSTVIHPPRSIDYFKLDTFSIIGLANKIRTLGKMDTLSTSRPGAKLVQLRQLTSWGQNGSHSALYCNYSQIYQFLSTPKNQSCQAQPIYTFRGKHLPHSPLPTSGTILVFLKISWYRFSILKIENL